MGTVRKLLDFLPTYFDVDPHKSAAFKIEHVTGAPIRYSVEDNRIYASILGGMSKDFELTLSGKTIQDIVAEIDDKPKYLATALGDCSLGATCLMDVEDSSDPVVYYFDNPIWTIMKAAALEFAEARAMGDEILRQLSVPGATGIFADYWAEFFGVTRRLGEADDVFGQRIIDTVRRTRSNNTAMAIILQIHYGYRIQVHDSSFTGDTNLFLMNNEETPFHDYDFPIYIGLAFGAGAGIICLIFPEGTVSQWGLADFEDLREIVLKIKAAGYKPKVFWPDEPIFSAEDIPFVADGPFYSLDLFW